MHPSPDFVARYWRLPYPQLTPAQEFVHEVGITADCNAVVTDCVWRIFTGGDVYAVRQFMGHDLAPLTCKMAPLFLWIKAYPCSSAISL